MQLNIFVCAPFGEYAIELKVESTTVNALEMQQRTAWEIEDGAAGEV